MGINISCHVILWIEKNVAVAIRHRKSGLKCMHTLNKHSRQEMNCVDGHSLTGGILSSKLFFKYSFFSQDKPQRKVWTRVTETMRNKHYDIRATEQLLYIILVERRSDAETEKKRSARTYAISVKFP